MQLPSASTYAWPATLFLFVLAATPIFGCVTPFVAASAAAAGTMDRRAGALTVLACWAANQAMGFGFMGYPVDGYAIGWGAAIAGGAMLAWVAARMVARKGATLVQVGGGAALGLGVLGAVVLKRRSMIAAGDEAGLSAPLATEV